MKKAALRKKETKNTGLKKKKQKKKKKQHNKCRIEQKKSLYDEINKSIRRENHPTKTKTVPNEPKQ